MLLKNEKSNIYIGGVMIILPFFKRYSIQTVYSTQKYVEK